MIRIAIGQIRPKKGDYSENLRRMGSVIAQAVSGEDPADLVVFPETMTSGYFVEGGVRDVAVSAGTLFRDLSEQVGGLSRTPDVVVGFYEQHRNRYYNSALYASLGGITPGIKHVHRKIFLPTYGVFDEKRFVDPGHSVQAFDTPWGRAAMVICEDAWHSLVPTIAALDGAQILIVPSASPARGPVPANNGGSALPDSVEKWGHIARSVSGEHSIFVVLAHLVGFEGGKGFPGGSLIAGPSGDIIASAPVFEETLMTASIALDEITGVRADQPLLSDLEAELPHLIESLKNRDSAPVEFGPADVTASPVMAPGPSAFGMSGAIDESDPLAMDSGLLRKWLSTFLVDEVKNRRGFEKGIVAISGGVDSALTAYLAVDALGADNVIGLNLPYSTSSSESADHARLVAEELGIKFVTVDISAAVDGYFSALPHPADATRRGNVMARTRMISLFDHSAALKALPLGTGNKTERLLGYFTWHADDSPSVNPLGDLFKTQVWQLARDMGVPESIVTKPATADLVAGQTDEGDLGISYEKADRILYWLIRGMTEAGVTGLGFSPEEVALVNRRLQTTHWKRRLPTVAMVSQTAIGEYYLRPVDY